jgi:hypothetical protein
MEITPYNTAIVILVGAAGALAINEWGISTTVLPCAQMQTLFLALVLSILTFVLILLLVYGPIGQLIWAAVILTAIAFFIWVILWTSTDYCEKELPYTNAF